MIDAYGHSRKGLGCSRFRPDQRLGLTDRLTDPPGPGREGATLNPLDQDCGIQSLWTFWSFPEPHPHPKQLLGAWPPNEPRVEEAVGCLRNIPSRPAASFNVFRNPDHVFRGGLLPPEGKVAVRARLDRSECLHVCFVWCLPLGSIGPRWAGKSNNLPVDGRAHPNQDRRNNRAGAAGWDHQKHVRKSNRTIWGPALAHFDGC